MTEAPCIHCPDNPRRARAEALLASQTHVLEMIALGRSLPEVLGSITRMIEEVCPETICAILLVDATGQHLRCGSTGSLPPTYAAAIDGLAIGPQSGSCGAAAYHRRSIFTPDIATDPVWKFPRELALAHGLRSCWSAPIFSSTGHLLGTFAIYDRRAREPDEERLTLLETASRLAGIAVERIRIDRALQDSEQRLRLALESAQMGTWDHDPLSGMSNASPRAKTLWGVPTDTPVEYEAFIQTVLPEDRVHIERVRRQILNPALDSACEVEYRIHRADGAVRWIAGSSKAIWIDMHGQRQLLRLLGTVRDVTDRKQFEDHLKENDATLRRLIDANIIGIIQGHHELITDANDIFLRMVGYTRQDVQAGRLRWPDITPSGFLELDRHAAHEMQTVGAFTAFEKEYIRKDGARVPVLVGGASLNQGNEKWICYVMDLSERRRYETDVTRAKEDAEAANQAKDQFLAVLSHELRTPLTPVLTAVQLMESDPALPSEERESVEMIHRNVELEARLIDDLLDLTRITRGKLELHFGKVDLHAMVHHVVEICDSDIRSRQLQLSLDLQALRSLVRGDAARLQQVLWNLLKNAVKFTRSGGTIAVRTANLPDGQIRLTIQDSGVGIDPELLPRIFNAFEQGGSRTTRAFGGLGLGLAISKGLIDLHGGTLIASSEGKGRGAIFTLDLNTIANGQPAPNHPDADASPLARGEHLLLVEDHIDTARIMSRVLRRLGYDVRVADSVASARQAADAERFDLIVSDIGLPDGSGLDLMRQLCMRYPTRGIAMSGYGTEEDHRKSHEAGFIAHLTKPVDLKTLEQTLRQVSTA